jgi:hypothetical protein
MTARTADRDLDRNFLDDQKEEKRDLGDWFATVVETVNGLFGPSEDAIAEAGDSLLSMVHHLSFKLLSAEDQATFDAVLATYATPVLIREFDRLVQSSAGKAWLRQNEQKQKVAALRPPARTPNAFAVELKEDVESRALLLQKQLQRRAHGFRQPPKGDFERAYALFLASLMAVEMAAVAVTVRFEDRAIERAHFSCTEALFQLAELCHIPAHYLSTRRDARRADEVFKRSDEAHAAHERHEEALRRAELDALLHAPDF